MCVRVRECAKGACGVFFMVIVAVLLVVVLASGEVVRRDGVVAARVAAPVHPHPTWFSPCGLSTVVLKQSVLYCRDTGCCGWCFTPWKDMSSLNPGS